MNNIDLKLKYITSYKNIGYKKCDIEFITFDGILIKWGSVALNVIDNNIFDNEQYTILYKALTLCFIFKADTKTEYKFENINYQNLMFKIKNKMILFDRNKKTLLFKKHLLKAPRTTFDHYIPNKKRDILIKFTTRGWIKLLKWLIYTEEIILKLKKNYEKLYADIRLYKIE